MSYFDDKEISFKPSSDHHRKLQPHELLRDDDNACDDGGSSVIYLEETKRDLWPDTPTVERYLRWRRRRDCEVYRSVSKLEIIAYVDLTSVLARACAPVDQVKAISALVRLRYRQIDAGHKDGWVGYQFRHAFGDWPHSGWQTQVDNIVEMLYPLLTQEEIEASLVALRPAPNSTSTRRRRREHCARAPRRTHCALGRLRGSA